MSMSTGALMMCMPMLALLAWAALIDLRDRRIPNWLTVSLALAGLAQSFTWAHTVTPGAAALGFATGFGITFVLFGLGALGGGDVKLLAGLGAWLGPPKWAKPARAPPGPINRFRTRCQCSSRFPCSCC